MLMMNITCVPDMGRVCPPSSSPAGLAAGLTVFFLLLLVAGVVVYIYRGKIRDMLPFGQRSNSGKEDCIETPQQEPHQYSSMSREQPAGQIPIYENLTTQTARHSPHSVKQSRPPVEPEEDLYLQCDSLDDGIYYNDPTHNSNHPDLQEEDVYIMPDS